MAELILLKSNWAAQNHAILALSFLLPVGWLKKFGPPGPNFLSHLPFSLPLPLGWLKKFGPLGPNFLSRLPLSLPAPSGAAQEVWP